MSNVSVEMAGTYFEKDDYYSGENGPGKAVFFGQGAKELGIDSTFDHTVFENLLHGFSTDGSKQLIQIKPRELTGQELEKVQQKFTNSISKLGMDDAKTAFVSELVTCKATASMRHFTRSESRELGAEVGKYISLLSLDSETKKGFKRASTAMIKSLSKSGHRAGLDCTFSAPKSLSIACLVGGRKELLEAHKTAVDEAMGFIEARLAGTRVGGKSTRQFARTGNVIGAKFHHGTSREGDPQLHTHCVIMNMTQRDKSSWRAMYTDPIYQHSKLAGLLYQNKLAELVQKKGYEIEVKNNGTFELKGYTSEHLAIFSKRRKQVMEVSAKGLFEEMRRNQLVPRGAKFESLKPELLQRVTQKMNRKSVLENRQVKSEIKSENLQERWQKEANDCGIKHPEYRAKKILFGSKLDHDFGKNHTTERNSVIKKLDLLVQNLTRNLGRATSREIARAGYHDLDLIISRKDQSAMVSLPHAAKEAEILKLALSGKGSAKAIMGHGVQDFQKVSTGLTEDQKRAIATTLESKDCLLMWNGVAGAGKTWALAEVKENATKSGYRVIALAPDASSASVLGNQLGTTSSTVHSFLRGQHDRKKTLLIVDEAGKFSTKLMHDLLKKIEGTNTRVILSGDHRQLGAIEAGNPYKALLKSGVTVTQLNESMRQKSPQLKSAVAAISTQRPEAIKWATKQLGDKIIERKTLEARINAAVKAYAKLTPAERQNTLIIADTNHERSLLTAHLREKKKSFGELGTKEHDLKILVPKDMTEAQKRCAAYFQKGDILVANSRSESLSSGKQYRVAAVDGGKIQIQDGSKKLTINPAKEAISVYQEQTIKIAQNEKLEWRRNHLGRENRDDVTVSKLSADKATLQLKSGKLVTIDLKTPQFLDYAHVSTTYSSQGATADRVIALTQSNTSRESFYVAVSRARHDVQIVTDDKIKLVERALKSSAKENASKHIEYKNLEPKTKGIEMT